MDWNNALVDSALWIAKAYVITIVLAGLAVAWLVRRTVWGRQFWRLSGAFFSPRRDWRPLATLALILLLTLGAVRLDVLFSMWYNSMYTSLQKLDEAGFWFAMWLFAILATVHILRSLIDFFIQQAFTIRWREWLNESLLSQWLSGQAYYRSQYVDQPVDNPDQRIQQDITLFAQTSLALSMGVINALVSTFAYTLILWNLSGPLALLGVEIPRAMVFLVFIYVLVATLLAIRIGRPLILLNFLNERYNADYRYSLVRLREYAESIAFYVGEKVEGTLLRSRFAQVISNAWAIVHRSLRFLGFNFVVTQTAVVFPFILQAQRFFSQQITLGDLIQTSQAFGQLQANLSFFRNAYDEFASYRATLDRLSGFTRAIDQSHALPSPTLELTDRRLELGGLTVRTPAGALLVEALSLEVRPDRPLLIRGPSGSGKTTLLRAIAGLWPHAEGRILRPDASQTLFLSQKPYLPQGSLRDALYYPAITPGGHAGTADLAAATPQRIDRRMDDALPATHRYQAAVRSPAEEDARAREVLALVQLGHLADRLDEVAEWSRILSLGEQQRLAFGRLLLAAPQLAFLDEATSAMDEGLEDAMYRLTRERLPDTVLISVGHRSTLFRYHPRQLELQGDGSGRWALRDGEAGAPTEHGQ